MVERKPGIDGDGPNLPSARLDASFAPASDWPGGNA
jgi:hypothetical protein